MMQRSIMTTTSLEHSSLPRLTVSTRIRSQKTKIEIVDRQSYSKMSAFPSTLRVLTIHNCQLKRIDSRIITLPRLNVLHLSNNAIVDIPVKIGVMCINELNLSNNSITLIPQGIFVDSNLCLTLQTLNLSHNALSSIPATVGNLVLLHTFNLSGNKLTQLPDSLGDLQRLKFLTLDNNFLDSLPGRIIKLKLDYIDISRNPFQCSDTYITDLDSCPTLLEWAARSFLKSG